MYSADILKKKIEVAGQMKREEIFDEKEDHLAVSRKNRSEMSFFGDGVRLWGLVSRLGIDTMEP